MLREVRLKTIEDVVKLNIIRKQIEGLYPSASKDHSPISNKQPHYPKLSTHTLLERIEANQNKNQLPASHSTQRISHSKSSRKMSSHRPAQIIKQNFRTTYQNNFYECLRVQSSKNGKRETLKGAGQMLKYQKRPTMNQYHPTNSLPPRPPSSSIKKPQSAGLKKKKRSQVQVNSKKTSREANQTKIVFVGKNIKLTHLSLELPEYKLQKQKLKKDHFDTQGSNPEAALYWPKSSQKKMSRDRKIAEEVPAFLHQNLNIKEDIIGTLSHPQKLQCPEVVLQVLGNQEEKESFEIKQNGIWDVVEDDHVIKGDKINLKLQQDKRQLFCKKIEDGFERCLETKQRKRKKHNSEKEKLCGWEQYEQQAFQAMDINPAD